MLVQPVGTTELAVSNRFSLLRASHRIDWRFLLPDVHLGQVAYLGDDDELVASLKASGATVEHLEAPNPPPLGAVLFDGAVVSADAIDYICLAKGLLRQGGWLYVELPPKRLIRGPGSLGRYRKALLQLGFERVENYWHFPSFRFHRAIIPLTEVAPLNTALARRESSVTERGKEALAKLAAKLGLFAGLARHVSLVAVLPRAGSSDSALIQFLAARREELQLERYGFGSPHMPHLLITPPGIESSCVVALLHPEDQPHPTIVSKLSRLRTSRARLAREADNLRALHAAWPAARGCAPEVITLGGFGDYPLLLETALPGDPLDPPRLRRAPFRFVTSATEWLFELSEATAASMQPNWYQRLVEAPIQRLGWLVPDEDLPAVVHETLERLEVLRTAPIFSVFEHGDFAYPNVIVTAQNRIGAVDWEGADPHGLPVQDLIFFLSYVAFVLRGAEEPEDRLAAFHDAFMGADAWAAGALARFGARAGIGDYLLAPLVLACWARYTAMIVSRLCDAEDFSPRHAHESERAAPIGVRSHVGCAWETALWRHVLEHYDELVWPTASG